MEVDYKELCQRLFGTTDVEELEKIAEKYQAKNDRGAGRKPKFSKAEYYFMNLLHKHGIPVKTIANEFGTSRQTVYKYLDDSSEMADISVEEAIATAEAEWNAGLLQKKDYNLLQRVQKQYL